MWLEQVYTNNDYDMTAVLHVEPRDIGNYANPDYYWQLRQPRGPAADRRRQGGADPDEATELLKQAARQISEDSPVDWLHPRRRPHRVDAPDVTGYPTNDTASRFDASGITVAG